MAILGPDGRPIEKSVLTQEIAAPTLTGVRQIVSGHPAQGLTPARLAGLLREAEQGDPMRYLELAEEMEEKDLHYLSVLGTRKRAVAQLEITVEPASESAEHQRHAELVRNFLERDELEDELVDILDAVGKGYSATEIVWETSARQWMPVRLEWRDPRWFAFDQADGRTLQLRSESGFEPLPPFKFVLPVMKAKSGIPIRGGLARAAAWAYLFKNYDIKDWVAFAEVYGQPIRVGKYHPNATQEERETLLRAVANIGADAAAIVPQSMLIEFVQADTQKSADLYEKLADWLDRQLSKAVLGQTLTTEVKGGSFAAAKVHDSVREDIERADAKQVAAALNRDLVRPIVELNFGPQQAWPRIVIGRPEEADVGALSEALAKLVPLGLKVSQAEIRGKIGMADPADSDEILTGQAPAGAAPPAPGQLPRQLPGLPTDPRSSPGQAPAARARAEDVLDDDAIDDLVVAALGDWEALAEPVLDPIREVVQEAASFDELQARLAELLPRMDMNRFAERLARARFAARLAGEAGAPVTDDES